MQYVIVETLTANNPKKIKVEKHLSLSAYNFNMLYINIL